jgi:cardiolipin synthase
MSDWLVSLQALVPHLLLALSMLWAVYLVGLSVWIVLQKREPIATLSWIMSLALLPYVGLVIYYFFGPQRIHRQRLKRVRAKAGLAPEGAIAETEPPGSLQRLAQGCGGYPPSQCARVALLVDGSETYDALVAAISGAREHVHLEYYIYEPDATGARIRDALVARARAGIKVRLLLDALGSGRMTKAFLAPLLEAGGEVAWFHPFHPFRLARLLRPRTNLRSHRKIVVVDGRIGFTGGINITDGENPAVRADAYHDLHVHMEGEAVRWLQLAFVEDWVYAGGALPREPALWPATEAGAIRTQVLPAGPDSSWEAIHRLMIAAIYQARKRVWLATPYFVPGEAARMALTSAAQRGLDVRVLVPRMSDSKLVTAAARSYYSELLRAGIRVYEYPRMLHAKALLLDDDHCVLGSSNFDYRSFRLNFELCVLFEDAGLAARLAEVLDRDLGLSAELHGPRRRPFLSRLAEAGARLLSPIL